MAYYVLVLFFCISAGQGKTRSSRKANLKQASAAHFRQLASRSWETSARSLRDANSDEHRTDFEKFSQTDTGRSMERMCDFESFHIALLTGFLEFYVPFSNTIPLGMFFQEVIRDSLTLHFSSETSQFSPAREDEFFDDEINEDDLTEEAEGANQDNAASCVTYYEEMQTLHTFMWDTKDEQNNQHRWFHSRFPAKILPRREWENEKQYLKRLEAAALTRVPVYPKNFSLLANEDEVDFILRLEAAKIAKAPIMPKGKWETKSEFVSRLTACRELSVIVESRGRYETPIHFTSRLKAAKFSRAPIDVKDVYETDEEFQARLDATREAAVRILSKSERLDSNETNDQFLKRLDAAKQARAGIWPKSLEEDDELFELRLAAARVAPAMIHAFDSDIHDDDKDGFRLRVEAAKEAPSIILPKAVDPEERDDPEEETDAQFRLRVNAAKQTKNMIARKTRNETDSQFELRLEIAQNAKRFVHGRNRFESDDKFRKRLDVAKDANVEIFAWSGITTEDFNLRLEVQRHAKSFVIPRDFSLASPDNPEEDEDEQEYWYPETQEEYHKRLSTAKESPAMIWPKGIHEDRSTFYERLDAASKSLYAIWPKGKFESIQAFRQRLKASQHAHSMLYPFNGSGLFGVTLESTADYHARLKACEDMPLHASETNTKPLPDLDHTAQIDRNFPVYLALLAFVVVLAMFVLFISWQFVGSRTTPAPSATRLTDSSPGIEMMEQATKVDVESW